MAVGIHGVSAGNGDVVEQAEAVAACGVLLAGDHTGGACVVARWPHRTEGIARLCTPKHVLCPPHGTMYSGPNCRKFCSSGSSHQEDASCHSPSYGLKALVSMVDSVRLLCQVVTMSFEGGALRAHAGDQALAICDGCNSF